MAAYLGGHFITRGPPPYAGITQIRCEGVDSISADLSAWLYQAPPARYLFVKYPPNRQKFSYPCG